MKTPNLQTTLHRLPSNPDYVKVSFSGRAGRMVVRGESLGIHLGIYDEVTYYDVLLLLEHRVHRTDDSGREVPGGVRAKVVAAVLAVLQEAGPRERK